MQRWKGLINKHKNEDFRLHENRGNIDHEKPRTEHKIYYYTLVIYMQSFAIQHTPVQKQSNARTREMKTQLGTGVSSNT